MRTFNIYICIIFFVIMLSASGCKRADNTPEDTNLEYASLFDIVYSETNEPMVITISPYSAKRDTFFVKSPLSRLICMSSTHVAALSAIGCDSVVVGVSGRNYLSNLSVKDNAVEVGYDPSLDYEAILSVEPQLVLAYTVSEALPAYVTKLQSLGIPVLVINDQMEEHPLARCEYVRLFGALTGKEKQALDYFKDVEKSYNEIVDKVKEAGLSPKKILINTPYSGAWYIPGGENYTSRLIKDAGGEILGSVPSQSASSVISIEEAFVLSAEADLWLNPGWCTTVDDLKSVNPLFAEFPVIDKLIYNNTLRTNSEGGNDFWESGAVCPDKILSDLVSIINPDFFKKDSLEYYIKVQ